MSFTPIDCTSCPVPRYSTAGSPPPLSSTVGSAAKPNVEVLNPCGTMLEFDAATTPGSDCSHARSAGIAATRLNSGVYATDTTQKILSVSTPVGCEMFSSLVCTIYETFTTTASVTATCAATSTGPTRLRHMALSKARISMSDLLSLEKRGG